MTDVQILTLQEIEDLAQRALVNAGTPRKMRVPLRLPRLRPKQAELPVMAWPISRSIANTFNAERWMVRRDRVRKQPAPAVTTVDAATGFAHPAIDLGLEALVPAARDYGVAALALHNSYNCGVLGCHTRRLAEDGLLGIGFTNAPASIVPVGGCRSVVGTNPFSIAAPDGNGSAAILIDQSASVIAKSEITKHAREGRPIPPEWALDSDGQPTTDPDLALKGSMAPSGGYKGVGVALMVEMMAAAMTGATLGFNASPFLGTKGGPPKTGQFFLAIDPGATSGDHFAERLAALVEEMRDQPGVRVPGDGRNAARRRAKRKGVEVSSATLEKISKWM